MEIDPVVVVVEYLHSLPDFPAGSVTGDLVGWNPEGLTVYVQHSGGFRMVRDRMDRADIEYDVYHPDRGEAVRMAYRVRRYLLESLRASTVGNAEVLDVTEIQSPQYYPDPTSRSHMYGGEVSVFYVEA